MGCYHPVIAYQGEDGVVTFSELRRHGSMRSLELPCGRCVGCRLERSRQWAVRCVHEAQMHAENCFITLTYDEAHVPEGFSLRYVDFQKFMRELRRETGRKVRFFMCGEYGGEHSRPHFHACLFGFDFSDKIQYKRVGGGAVLYRSPSLEKLWRFGFSTIGAVTFESAAYVARYVMKKVADAAASVVVPDQVDRATGEIVGRCPEFCHMSLKPGIGKPWLDKFFSDVYPSGKVVVHGKEWKAPRYYDRVFSDVDSDAASILDYDRSVVARQYSEDNSASRLAVREVVAAARLRSMKRKV